jgi:hypothetical protein
MRAEPAEEPRRRQRTAQRSGSSNHRRMCECARRLSADALWQHRPPRPRPSRTAPPVGTGRWPVPASQPAAPQDRAAGAARSALCCHQLCPQWLSAQPTGQRFRACSHRCSCHICAGTGLPLPHLRRDWAPSCHICAGTGLAPAKSAPGLGPPATSAPGLGSRQPHLHPDWVSCSVRACSHLSTCRCHGLSGCGGHLLEPIARLRRTPRRAEPFEQHPREQELRLRVPLQEHDGTRAGAQHVACGRNAAWCGAHAVGMATA